LDPEDVVVFLRDDDLVGVVGALDLQDGAAAEQAGREHGSLLEALDAESGGRLTRGGALASTAQGAEQRGHASHQGSHETSPCWRTVAAGRKGRRALFDFATDHRQANGATG